MPPMMRSRRTFAHTLATWMLGGAALVACSTGGSTGSDNEEEPDASTDGGSVCDDGVCEPDEINTCEPDCGAPPACNNNDICDAGEAAATCDDCVQAACDFDDICEAGETAQNCSDCLAPICNENDICEGGETPENCTDCETASDCGDCDPADTECITDHCGDDQACLQACLPSGFDCETLICPAFEFDPITCALFCEFFGGGGL
jgi:hypothetical protein